MYSKITIDFAFSDNSPLIKLHYRESDDVRDKMVRSFLERRGYFSETLSIFSNPSDSDNDRVYEITPVEDELEYFKKRIIHYKRSCQHYEELTEEQSKIIDDFFKWLNPPRVYPQDLKPVLNI